MDTSLLLETKVGYDPLPLWHALSREVLVRLQLNTSAEQRQFPEAHYLVATGFFKLLRELDVRAFRHSYGRKGLRFYLEVEGSFASIKAYLLNLKQWHALGRVWDFSILDGLREYPVQISTQRHRPRPTHDEVCAIARGHLHMGSRPLRFSKYLFYAALAPFGRTRCYGSCSMLYEDAREEADFTRYLQAADQLATRFRVVDFSSVRSLQELRALARPMEAVLGEGETPLFRGLLFHSAFFAAAYEQKVPAEKYPTFLRGLSAGLERDYFRGGDSFGLRLFREQGIGGARMLALQGYDPIFTQALPFWQQGRDLDDLSLFLFSQIFDTTTLEGIGLTEYRSLQSLCAEALQDAHLRRDAIQELFCRQGLVTDGCRDLISLTLLADQIAQES